MSIDQCCIRGFAWDGTPQGHEGKLGSNNAYITGTNPDRAILVIHDLFGWTFPNIRLLADRYAAEADATAFVPDFFGGEVLPFEPIAKERFDEIDLAGFMGRHGREVREPEIFECARALRSSSTSSDANGNTFTFKKIGAIGFCYGGWAVFRLGAKEHSPPLVDCISTGHPTFLTKHDIDGVGVPTQILAPEFDPVYTPEMKSYTVDTVQKIGVPFDYQFFPGVVHSCFVRGDPDLPGEQKALVRGQNAAASWLKQFLKDDE